jgi:probable F420-dependent oxidoreductase
MFFDSETVGTVFTPWGRSTLKIGLNLVRVRPDRMPDLSAHAEALGYESVFVPDHVVVPVSFTSKYPGTPDGSFPYPQNTPLYDPWTMLTAIGRATANIRLGMAVYILALRHPILTARSAVTLEHYVGPRLLLGIGVGWLTEEFDALGINPRSRFSRTEECAIALRRLWTEEQPSFHGQHFSFDAVHFEPKPRTRPHPPLLFGGDSDAAMRRALRFGDGWMSGGVAENAEEVAQGLGRLDAARVKLTAEADKRYDPARPFEITVLHPAPTARDLERMAEIGVHRVVVMPWEHNRDAPVAIDRFMAMARDTVQVDGGTAGA